MKVATWNVNSVRARLQRLARWLDRERPDALCLQELKVSDEAFPHEAITEAGYHAAVFGQKTYNGVAVLSRVAPQAVERGFTGGGEEARLISARLPEARILSAYVPNGRAVGSDAYASKLAWLGRLLEYLQSTARPNEPVILAGDFNVAPRDVDAENPERWADSVLCHHDARAALQRIRDWGFIDVVEAHHPEGGTYSWWDYQRLAFPMNDGLRIDHIYATVPLAQVCAGAWIDRDERKGKKTDVPSDHAPVVAEFRI